MENKMNSGDELPADIDWSLTTFEGSRREQLRRWAQLPIENIVTAQEAMQVLAASMASSPDSPPAKTRTSPADAPNDDSAPAKAGRQDNARSRPENG